MKRLLFVLALTLGCGSGGGTGSSFSAASTISTPGTLAKSLSFKALKIGKNQVLPFNNILRCLVKNEGAISRKFKGLSVSFTSSNPLFEKINIQFLVDGKKVSEVYPAYGSRKTHLECDIDLGPGQEVLAYILVNPHALLNNDTLTLRVHDAFIDSKQEVVIIPSQRIVINPGGVVRALITEVPLWIPYQVGTQEIIVWQERLEAVSSLEQELYDYEIRFRSGDRNKSTNLDMRGTARLDVQTVGSSLWRKIDEIPVAGHPVIQQYKLFFFGETIPTDLNVRIVVNLSAYKPSDLFLIDRTTIGSDTGFVNYPTQHGPVFKCK